jgi:5'(3')-deoxyribonucleotidase
MNGYVIVDSYKGHSLKMSKPDSEGDHGFLVIMDEFPSTSLYIGHGKDVHHFIDWYRGLIDEYGYISGLGAPSVKNQNRKMVFVDLDNVMADYGGDFLRWATNGQLSPSPNDLTSLHLNEILCLDDADYAELKRRWRVEGHKRNMTMIPGTHGALRRLSQWYDVVIISSRPADKYDNIREDTEYWLKQHDLQYSELVFTKEKFDYVHDHYDVDDVLAIFDDDPKNLVKFAGKQTVQCYIVDRPYNRTGAPFVHRFRTLYDAACHFIGMNEPWKDER